MATLSLSTTESVLFQSPDIEASNLSNSPQPTPLEENLAAWCEEAKGTDEHEKRLIAALRIKKAVDNRASMLDLSHLQLSSLPECIDELAQLKFLALNGNRISDLRPLEPLANLRSLFLAGNQISDLEPLISLTQLTLLDLSRNLINDISPLRHLPLLRRLVLSSNEINDFTPLSLIPTLEVLQLSNCKLSNLAFLTGLGNLTHLDLSHNPIRNLAPIASMTHLESLDLERTDIEEIPLSLAKMGQNASINTKNTPLIFAAIRAFQNAIREAHEQHADLGPQFILPAETDTPPYNMVAALGFQNPPSILRAAHPTAPVMGPKISTLLNKLGAHAADFDLQFDISPDLLSAEVHKGIQIARTSTDPGSLSERLLKIASDNPDEYPTIRRIQECAEKAMSEKQGLALPGGLNVEPEFYDAAAPLEPKEYLRTVAEICLIDAAQRQKKPIIGTCRGAQLLNVKCGGTLQSAGHAGWGTIELSASSKKMLLENLLGSNTISAYSHHAQSCANIADNLEVVMDHDGIPKLLMNEDASIIAVQAHPEYDENELYSKSIEIYRIFLAKVKESLQAAADVSSS